MKRRRAGAAGFTLVEVLVALVVVGIVSLGASRLYLTTFGVQNKIGREFDLRQKGLQVLAEMGRGFRFGEAWYPGVYGAWEVNLHTDSSAPALEIKTAAGTDEHYAVLYRWDREGQTLSRTLYDVLPGDDEAEEPEILHSEILLAGVERFAVACHPSAAIALVELELVAAGKPQPRVQLETSLRPRVAEINCGAPAS